MSFCKTLKSITGVTGYGLLCIVYINQFGEATRCAKTLHTHTQGYSPILFLIPDAEIHYTDYVYIAYIYMYYRYGICIMPYSSVLYCTVSLTVGTLCRTQTNLGAWPRVTAARSAPCRVPRSEGFRSPWVSFRSSLRSTGGRTQYIKLRARFFLRAWRCGSQVLIVVFPFCHCFLRFPI